MSDNLRGIVAMSLSMAFFTLGDGFVKVVGRDLPVSEIMALRGVFASATIGAVAVATGAFRQWRSLLTPLMAWRTLGEIGATVFFFLALMRLPFADAAAIGQITPLVVTAAAALFLAEPVGWRRWTATAVGFLGALWIIQPGAATFNPAAALVLVCVVAVTVRDLVTRRIGDTIPVVLITFAAAASVTLAGFAIAPFERWVVPDAGHLGKIAIAALMVLAGYICTILATRSGDISIVSPFRYTSILFAILGSVLVFGEPVEVETITGVVVVVGAGLYTLHRERVRMSAG